MSDNAMSWLEPTRQCNLHCDACFHTNDASSRKTLGQIETELTSMLAQRRCDAMLIAGGEPLTHPEIAKVVRLVKKYKCKPALVTNGMGLDAGKVKELKVAGLMGFVFHVDSHQSRPGWSGSNEGDLNTLREELATLVYRAGGMACAFNITVFPDTLSQIPAVVDWAVRNVHMVQGLTLIAVRMTHPSDPWDYWVGNRRVEISETPYVSEERYAKLTAQELYNQIVQILPHYRFNAYLGGTVLPDSTKWVVGNHIASRRTSYGNVGPRTMELLQNVHHAWFGKYLAYTKPQLNRKAKWMFLLAPWDRELRKALAAYAAAIIKNPLRAFEKLRIQSLTVVQPVDILPNGEMDTCDGCPNRTYWNGRLVAACRFDEYLLYGGPIRVTPQ
jgi:hypothetical protein